MSVFDWPRRRSSRNLKNAAASSGVKYSLPASSAGRSSGVYVSLVQEPWRAGCPSAIRGAAQGFAGESAGLGPCANAEKATHTVSETAVRRHRVSKAIGTPQYERYGHTPRASIRTPSGGVSFRHG